jgi:hypothetical protein
MLREWLKAEPLPQVDSFGELWRAIGEPSQSLGSEAVRYVAGFLKTCSHQGKHLFDALCHSLSTEILRKAARLLGEEQKAIIGRWEPGLI